MMEAPLALRVHGAADCSLSDFLKAPHAVRSTARQVLVLSGHVPRREAGSSAAEAPFATELGASFAAAHATIGRPFEVVVLDGCPVGALDALTELSPFTRCVVTTHASTSDANLRRVVERLSRHRGVLGSAEIASSFVAAYSPTGPTDACVAVHVAGAQFSLALESLADASSILADWLVEHPQRRARLYELLEATAVQDFIDVGEVARVLRFVSWVPEPVIAAFDHAAGAFARSVLSRVSGVEHATAIGVSLVLPTRGDFLRSSCTGTPSLSFARRTRWLDVLDALFSA
jgi:hypothetical protein